MNLFTNWAVVCMINLKDRCHGELYTKRKNTTYSLSNLKFLNTDMTACRRKSRYMLGTEHTCGWVSHVNQWDLDPPILISTLYSSPTDKR